MSNKFLNRLHEPWLDVKYNFNVVQNTLVYIKCRGTSQKVTKLQLNEHKGLLNENPISQYGKMYNLVVAR